MTEYATDTSEDVREEKEEELKPLEVKITNQPKEKEVKDPTWEDTIDIYNYTPTEEEIKEMTDAQ